MKRNIKSLFKFVVLAGLTVTCTVLVFKIIRNPKYFPKKNEIRNKIIPPSVREVVDFEKIDWHNYPQITEELNRRGIGEQGVKETKISIDSSVKSNLYSVNGFNGALSDFISVNRSVRDIRHPECKKKVYLKKLPQVSVVVPFHNEHWSTLLRTAHSVVNRSPPELLKEIILVDDCSTKDFSRKKLDDYVAANFTNVRVIHLPKREGLIRARLAGAKEATAEVLLFLDSHTEANVNWLPPLLEPIALNYKTCVCPFIDVIDYETFEYRAQDEGARGAFDWQFYYKRLPLLPEDLAHPSDPFKSPVMAGGLFAISTKFFWELGGYDPGLDIWGGEQYELSFKIWQCGGEMYDAPCSRVGHIYRKFAPFPNPQVGNFVGKNYRRVAEVWMDEYAEYLYQRQPEYRKIDPGDLTPQKELRRKLKCKSFKWFMENVAFDLETKYPAVEPPDFANGTIRSFGESGYCVHSEVQQQDKLIELRECKKGVNGQKFAMTWHKDIRIGSLCLDVSSPGVRSVVALYPCHGQQGNQLWKYNLETKQLLHGSKPRCLDMDVSERKVFVTDCSSDSETQKWEFEKINKKELEKLRN